MSSPKILCFLGLLSLMHCGYSAAQHRSYLRLLDREFTQLPVDILVQTLVSLVLVCYGAGHVAGEFQPIRNDSQSRVISWDNLAACPSFIVFEHRAKSLSPYFMMKSEGVGVGELQNAIA